MRYSFVLIGVAVSILAACTSNSDQTENRVDTSTTAAPVTPVAPACYTYETPTDSIRLHLTTQGDTVAGELDYRLAEKDANTGTIRGQMKGDTLFAEYTFQSEGMESVSEVVFLKKGDTWVEGYGDVEEKNGKMVFKPNAALTFDNKTVLTKVACQ